MIARDAALPVHEHHHGGSAITGRGRRAAWLGSVKLVLDFFFARRHEASLLGRGEVVTRVA